MCCGERDFVIATVLTTNIRSQLEERVRELGAKNVSWTETDSSIHISADFTTTCSRYQLLVGGQRNFKSCCEMEYLVSVSCLWLLGIGVFRRNMLPQSSGQIQNVQHHLLDVYSVSV